MSDFEFDPKNGFRAIKLARGGFLCKSEHFEKLGQNLCKGPKGHFQIISTFVFSEEESSEVKLVVPLPRHRFECS